MVATGAGQMAHSAYDQRSGALFQLQPPAAELAAATQRSTGRAVAVVGPVRPSSGTIRIS